MFHRKYLIGVMVSVLLLSFSARSQDPPRETDESARQAVRKKAIELLGAVAGQVESLRSAENRARIRSNIAELFWKDDEERSRGLFALVEEDIKTGFNEANPEDPRYSHTLLVFGQLRRDTLDRIAKHDPQLAMDFLRSTRTPPHIKLPYQMTDGEKILELHLAKQIAAKNPKLALKLGRASLAKGLSPELVSVIAQLKSTDKEASATLYKEIVDKLKSVNMDQDSIATLIAVTLIQSHPPPATDELVYRDLVGLLLTSALSAGCAEAKKDYTPQICFDIRSVVPQMEKYYASRAGQLRRWPQIEQGHDDSSEEVWEDVRQVTREGTVNEILALANKYPEISSQVHWAAVRKAEESGDVARARQIASEYPDPEQRREMLAQIERDQMWKSVNAEKLAAIQQQLSRLRNNYERINFLFHMAGQIGANDRKAALGLLNQASQMIDSNKSGKAQLETQIRLAMHYSYLKSDRGFAIMESVLPKLNQLITAAAALDGFENNYLRDGEWNMSSEGTVGRLLTDLAQSARVFGSFDFDRSVTMAGQFERPEIRLMAQLKIAQGVLAKQPNVVLTFQRE